MLHCKGLHGTFACHILMIPGCGPREWATPRKNVSMNRTSKCCTDCVWCSRDFDGHSCHVKRRNVKSLQPVPLTWDTWLAATG